VKRFLNSIFLGVHVIFPQAVYALKRYKNGLFEAKKTKRAKEKNRIIVKNYKHYSREEYMNALQLHVNFKCE
jgi:hypothetical protein